MKIAFIYLTKLMSDTPADANQTLNMVSAFSKFTTITYFSHWVSKKELKKILDFYSLDSNFHIFRLPITLITSSLLLEKITRGLYCLFILFYVRFRKYDVLYTRDFSFVYFLSMLPKFLRPKQQIVFEPHNMLHQVSTKISLEQEKKGMEMADIFVPTTEGAKQDLLSIFEITTDKILVQPNAVNLKNFLDVEKDEEWFWEQHPQLKDCKLIIYTGTFIEWKGVEILVEAAKHLNDEAAKILLIGGTGNHKERIEKFIASLKLGNKVFVEGFLPQKKLIKIMKMADIAVIPNNKMPEGIKYTSPLKTYEYMAMGLPIVASDLYAIRQLLTENEHCLFFEAENPKDLGVKLNILLNNKELRHTISKNNRNHALQYGWEKRAKNVLSFIKSSSKIKSKMEVKPIIKLLKSVTNTKAQELRRWFIQQGILKGHLDYTKFIVLCRSRVGSNLLLSYLNSHPNIVAHNELFGTAIGEEAKQKIAENSIAYVKDVAFGVYDKKIRAAGFKIFYYHAREDNTKQVWEYLQSNKDLRIIHLKRENLLRSYLSKKIATKTKKWEQVGKINSIDIGKKTVNLTKEECLKVFETTKTWELEGSHFFAEHGICEVSYERLVKNRDAVLSEIQKFLGVDKFELSAYLTKQNPEPLSALIKDYDELKAEFEGSEWEYLFEE